MSAPPEIIERVDEFNRNLATYRHSSYNETQTRLHFINPLFKALGWDVDNQRKEFEVVHEGNLTNPLIGADGKRRRAPDYIFSYGPQRRFVVEAKKPAVGLENNAAATLQVRSYGWSAQVPLGILTDFEEFAIYDTRFAPVDGEAARIGRIAYYRYDQYLDVWDKIAELFSREAVTSGSLDTFVKTVKPQRPTIPVDKLFLTEIEGWRRNLANDIAQRNPQIDVRQLNRFVQMTIDRIIFLRFCEDRGIEDYGRLQRLVESGRSIYPELVKLFQQADDRYNSGLFHFKKEAGRDDSDEGDLQLGIGDTPLHGMITKLYRPHGPYAFGVIPVEIIGQVYEQFLGKVITLNNHTAEIEYKPEVRKAGGVYYTPQYIVDYIVEHTVGNYLKGKQPKQITNLHILDGSCGSGSFLVGAYNYLIVWYLNWYVKHGPDKYADELYYLGNGQWRLTTKAKKDILLRHIYGLDIDTQAVEVTKLSLLLKMLEDEDDQTVQYRMAFERVLPDIDSNIKCGNSLICKDFFAGQVPTTEERRRVNPFDWAAAFPNVMQTGGFDVIIGNPPYIRIQTMSDEPQGKQILDFYKQHYTAAGRGNYDVYVLFVEQGLRLLGKGGRLGYILPHKFFNARYGEPLRGLLAKGKHVAEVVHFGDQQIFTNATTYTTLMFLNQQGSDEVKVTKVAELSTWRKTGKASSVTIPSSNVTSADWNFSVDGRDLLTRLNTMPVRLENVTSRIFQGIKTSADKIYIVEEREREDGRVKVYSKQTNREHWIEANLLHPLMKGGDSRRYRLTHTDRLILFPYALRNSGDVRLIPEGVMCSEYPLTWAYLTDNEQYLRNREDGKLNGPQWYAYGRTQALDVMPLSKIFTPDISTTGAYSLDKTGEAFFTGGVAGGYGILVKPEYSREYVLGLLNSTLLEWMLHQSSTSMRGGYYSHESRFIRSLPICTLDLNNPEEKAQHDRMVQMVQQMLELKQQEAVGALDRPTREMICDIDRAINQLAYHLYDLTAEEIKMVEAGSNLPVENRSRCNDRRTAQQSYTTYQ